MLQFPQLQHMVVVAFLIAASVSDLKKREVPDWVNYGLVISGAAFSILQSVIYADWRFAVFSALGLASALALAALMFYTGQWGGGDGKLLVGVGAVLGLQAGASLPFISAGSPFISFLANLVLVSFFYALAFGFFLAVRNRKRFSASAKKVLSGYSALRKALLVLAAASLLVVVLVDNFVIRLGIATLVIASFTGLYLSALAKAVEKSCMLKFVSPLKLTEGDWIARDVIVNGRRICGPGDLGIENGQIRQLIALYRKKRIGSILIKEGIPFAPTFLVAYLVTAFFGNVFLALLG